MKNIQIRAIHAIVMSVRNLKNKKVFHENKHTVLSAVHELKACKHGETNH